jgi:hypothetical protein
LVHLVVEVIHDDDYEGKPGIYRVILLVCCYRETLSIRSRLVRSNQKGRVLIGSGDTVSITPGIHAVELGADQPKDGKA